MGNIHLLILVHGMWGNPAHLAHMDKIIRQVMGSTGDISDKPELAVLVAKTNSEESTYDGIDWGGERVAQEILEEVKQHEDRGKTVTRFSITGYSLGGLVARYVIGILHQNKFFERVTPVNFNTIATPHLGIPRFPSTFSAITNYIGPRFLSRTGEQFFCVDKWSPKGRSLLDILADPEHIFYQALLLFPNIRIYANAINDLTVPYITAAIEEVDLFAEYETNGLEIEFHEKYKYLVKSYTTSSSPRPPRTREKQSLLTRIKTSTPPVPPILQGEFPLNLLVYALLPILFPAFVSLALVRLSISSHNSRTRIKALEVDESNKGRLADIIAKLESNVETVVLDMYDDSQGTPDSLSSMPSEDRVPQQELVDIVQRQVVSRSQALLSPVQRRCIENLNKIPQLQKERAFFAGVRNSHAIIVCRDVQRFPHHLDGEGVLHHWADHFEL